MSRYSGSNGGSNDEDNDYEDDITLKLKAMSTVRFTPRNANGFRHDQYGASFITNYDDAEILDGIVLRREDKPETWNVYSADKFFNLNPEDGLVYEKYDEEDGYSGEMSAQDVLDHPRVAGHSESGGGNDYYFEPVGVVIEASGDIAIHDDVDVETSDEPTIKVGGASMLNGNNSWVRTFAKKMSAEGDGIINDNGKDTTPRGEDDINPKYNDFEWMTTEDPSLREELEGRPLELWVTEETQTFEDGNEVTFKVPNLMDVQTGEFVTIDNDVGGGSDTEKAAATDGGTKSQSGSDTTDTDSTESTDSPSTDSDDGLPEGVPDHLTDLLGYLARNNESVDASQVEEFASDEVDSPEDVDWDAAAEAAMDL